MKDEIVVKWRCTAPKRNGDGQFNRIVACSNEAVMNKELGWLCDCGRWTKGSDDYHKPLKLGIRKIVDCRKLREGIGIASIMQIALKPKKQIVRDPTICLSCEISGCPGFVRFDRNYFELGYIETNLPICPHAEYEEEYR